MRKRSKPKFSPKLKASTLDDIKRFVPKDALNTPVISDYAALPASYQRRNLKPSYQGYSFNTNEREEGLDLGIKGKSLASKRRGVEAGMRYKFQNGGETDPFVTSDKDIYDYRKRMYDDSLMTYQNLPKFYDAIASKDNYSFANAGEYTAFKDSVDAKYPRSATALIRNQFPDRLIDYNIQNEYSDFTDVKDFRAIKPRQRVIYVSPESSEDLPESDFVTPRQFETRPAPKKENPIQKTTNKNIKEISGNVVNTQTGESWTKEEWNKLKGKGSFGEARQKAIKYQTGGQVVSDYDSVWDYKKEGDTVYTKRKNADKWIQPSEGSAAEAAIRNKVFGLIDGPTGPTGPVGAPAPVEPLTGAVGPGGEFHPKSPDAVVTPPKITVEDVLPSMPDIEMPTVEMPEMPSMDISMPDISVPDISMPDVNLPNVDLPTYEDRVAKNKAVQDKVKSALGSLGDLLPDLPEINFPDFDTPTYEDRVNKNKIVQDKAKRAVKKFRDFIPDLPDVNLPDVDFPSYEDRVERNKVVQDKSRSLLESFGEYLPDLPEMQPVVDRLIEDGNDFIDSAKSEVLEAIDAGTSSLSELKDYLGDIAEDSYSQRLGKNESIQNKVRGTIDKIKSKFELPEAIDAIEKVIKEETFEEMLVRGAQDLNTGVILADDQMYVMKDGVPVKKMPAIVGKTTEERKGAPMELSYATTLPKFWYNKDKSLREFETPEGLKTGPEIQEERIYERYGANTPAGIYKFTGVPVPGYENYPGYSSELEALPGTPSNFTPTMYTDEYGERRGVSSDFTYHPLPQGTELFRGQALEDPEITNQLSGGCVQNSDCDNRDMGVLLENNASFRDSLIILNSGMGDLTSKAIQELAEKFDMAQSKGEQKEVLQQLAQLSK